MGENITFITWVLMALVIRLDGLDQDLSTDQRKAGRKWSFICLIVGLILDIINKLL